MQSRVPWEEVVGRDDAGDDGEGFGVDGDGGRVEGREDADVDMMS